MIVEVIGGADEHPQARVVDIDDLGRLHLALGEVTDEEASEVLERAGLGDPLGRDGGRGAEQGLGVRGRRHPAGARGERRRGLIRADGRPLTSIYGTGSCDCSSREVIVVTPLTRQDVAVRMTSGHGIPS